MSEFQLTSEASTITAIPVAKRYHAVKPAMQNMNANYKGSGLAFCGILHPGESITDFRKRWVKSQMKFR